MVVHCWILLSEPFPLQKSVHMWSVVSRDNLSANSFSINCQLTFLFLLLLQKCGCWKDWSIHNSEHCVGKNEIRRCCRYLSDCQNVKDTAASHGADRGEENNFYVKCWWSSMDISIHPKIYRGKPQILVYLYFKSYSNCMNTMQNLLWRYCKDYFLLWH